jgi:hypothetical protein
MRRAVALPVMLFATLAFAQSAPSTLSGKWAGDWNHGPTPAETDHLVVSLATDAGSHVTGSVNVDKTFDVPIDWGFVQNDEVVFQISFPTEHGPFPLVFLGKAGAAGIDFAIAAHGLPPLPPGADAQHMTDVFRFIATKQPELSLARRLAR